MLELYIKTLNIICQIRQEKNKIEGDNPTFLQINIQCVFLQALAQQVLTAKK
jgi:hypothetical protein